ncbi:ribosomal RNA processing protein 1 homolog B [Paramormyrops kingsleyae]|uniref:ribosomal RNA processing protein 1 homolog B n=2 Tax=Paramormyrops kingsleyae TaxID=1676925 RepID=UPI003B97934F
MRRLRLVYRRDSHYHMLAIGKMAPMVQEPEIQFAQRLASNEKPIRTKAIKKLRKYLSVRSQKPNGGFTVEELLKIWKGLFYCLWMQDKPLLQEDLSAQISNLIHSLHNVDVQFLFLESFLKTMNREWNGIDGLRMDKFYMLVRFVFRQAFELLKRRVWDTGLVQKFVELLFDHVLRSTSDCPSGVQFHVLDIYMTELARVGAKELTAQQNLTFIDPFLRTAAKSKNHMLVQAICGTMFQEIVDHAPFAIEDLLNEIQGRGGTGEDDSGQASGDEEDEEGCEIDAVPQSSKKAKVKHVNGVPASEEDELSDFEEGDSLLPENDIGPVLQFDYKALAERLLKLSGRSNTPTFNRKKLYRAVKTFQDLGEGVFPQDEYPEEVSTDEDDDEMFGSRRRLKKRKMSWINEEDVDEGSKAKKRKGKKKEMEIPVKQKKGSVEGEATGDEGKTDSMAKKKKKRRKKNKGVEAGEPSVDGSEQNNGSAQGIPEAEQGLQVVREGQSEHCVSEKRTDPAVPERGEQGGATVTNQKGKRQKINPGVKMSDALSQHDVTAEERQVVKKKQRKRRNSSLAEEPKSPLGLETPTALMGGEQDSRPSPVTQSRGAEEAGPETAKGTATSQGGKEKRKKKKRMKETSLICERRQVADGGVCADRQPAAESPAPKAKAAAAKVTVWTEEQSGQTNGHVEGVGTKAPTAASDAGPGRTKKALKKKADGAKLDFVKFQSGAVPVPLFCRKSKGGRATFTKQVRRTPLSEFKKVTFGLKNNKTAEFRKTDRSLLVSPDGSSRVAFDPKQKPRFGVLKSPMTAQASKNSSSATQRRPCAADFF